MLFIGQGDLFAARRNADGSIQALRHLGEAPVFEFMIEVERVTDNETSSGLRRQILSVVVKQDGKVMFTLKEPTPENLAMLFYGEVTEVAAGTKSAQAMPTGLVAGSIYRVPGNFAKLTNVVVKDSAGAPRTLVAGTDYEVDLTFGTIVFKPSGITGSTQPFKVDFNYGAEKDVSMMSKLQDNTFLLFQGINTVDNSPCIVELYNCQLDPTKKFEGKGDKAAEYEVEGQILIDPTKPKNGPLGQFGRFRDLS